MKNFKKMIIRTFLFFGLSSIIYALIVLILSGLLSLTYKSLTKENLIASLIFERVAFSSYQAHVYDYKGSHVGSYLIDGNQWRINTDFVKLKYWTHILGMKPKYTLNRIEASYQNIVSDNELKYKEYDLESTNIIEYFSWFFDTSYRNSVYKKIRTNTKFNVLKTPTRLMVKEEYLSALDIKKLDLVNKSKEIFKDVKDSVLHLIE